jgi:ribosome-associated toxin RatA of RatAB toxin-antitoxin module
VLDFNLSVNAKKTGALMAKKQIKAFGDLDSKTLEALARRGQLVVVNKNGDQFISVTVGVAVDAPIDTVWQAATDYENYPSFMPQTESAKVRRNKDKSVEVDFVLAIKISALKIKVKYTILHVQHKPNKIDFHAIKGDIKTVDGSWEFIELRPKTTLALYTVYSDLKTIGRTVRFVLKQEPLLEMGINTTSAVMLMESFKLRVEKLNS